VTTKKRRPKPERWTAQTLLDESRILHAAVAISDRRTAWARQMTRLSRLLVWAAANLKELTP
jgi:hypothetical protein